MKISISKAVLFCALLILAICQSAQAIAQAPIYRFANPVLISGTDKAVGASYRFPSVIANVDAIVTIQTISGAITLQNIDRTADGYSEAFQPEYRIASLANAYIDFQIQFVKGGSMIQSLQAEVDATGLDIDGSTSGLLALKEFNTIDMGGGLCTFNTMASELSVSRVGTAFTGNNITGFLFGALVDTAAYQVMFTVSKGNVKTFHYRVGATTLLSGSSTRYASLYFKKFNYPTESVLPVSNLQSFKGTGNNGDNKLQWSLTGGNNAKEVVLERSATSNSFSEVATFWVNLDGNTQKDFNYIDHRSGNGATYYRLKIVSAEGKIQYSNVLYFQAEQAKTNTYAVFPSSVNSTVTAQFSSERSQASSFQVYDLAGRVVYSQALQLQQGQNNIRIDGLERLQAGNYVSAMLVDGKLYSQKLNKL